MARLNVDAARCEALFASDIQQWQRPSAAEARDAITRIVRQLGVRGCAARVAQEFGDHPEVAIHRMRWARNTVAHVFNARLTV